MIALAFLVCGMILVYAGGMIVFEGDLKLGIAVQSAGVLLSGTAVVWIRWYMRQMGRLLLPQTEGRP